MDIFVKITREGSDEWMSGAVTSAFNGHGVVPVVDWEPGKVVLPRLHPGTPLAELEDDAASAVIADVISRMMVIEPDTNVAVTADHWGSAFDRYLAAPNEQVDAALVERAQVVYNELLRTQRRTRLLHGDLHHYNILHDSGFGWVAIDPKGVIAELEFEFGPALRNPHGAPHLYTERSTVRKRVAAMARGMDVDADRVERWAFANAVLSLIWDVEDSYPIARDNPALLLAHALDIYD